LLLAATAFLVLRFVKHGPFSAFGDQFFIDSLNIFLIALTSLVAFTTSLFSGTYMRREKEEGRLTPGSLHLYHPMFQIFVLTMVLALSSNNLGILWVSMEAATLSTVLLVSLYRTKAGFGAAWNYFILCSVGISQALFGTILIYFSAAQVAGPDEHAILWTHLESIKDSLPPSVVSLAFIFLLVGYGAKAGLVPLHNWLPDAHAEGPTPVSALLSGLLLNVALYAILRVKILVDGALHSNFAGNLMMAFGLLSVVVAAFFLLRQKSLKRLFAYSSIEHVGLMTFAFGLGGVGSMAVSILAKQHYDVAAVNGIVDEKEYLLQIGAKNVVSIDEATDTSGRPLLKGLWAGAIDTLGGPILATTLKSMLYGATVTCCGNAGSPDLPTNVYPFILRGVTLIGIDSQNCPMPTRLKVWQKIAGDWKLDNLEQLTTEIPLEGLNDRIQMVLDRKHRGRTVVRLPD
jgi:hypothetical protein